ncbi:hydrolase [Nocardia sp. NBC_01388]|uniref:hydrolase n=1 Tax=Nocardia sp. NBC_01388 TaxID=2903596 RepID=UPI003247DC8D
MIDAGFARHFVPARWGGQAGSFADATTAVIEVAQRCASAAWCASLTAHIGRMCAYLPIDGQAALWHNGPDTLVVGALMPIGKAEATSGGWRVRGEWPYTSISFASEWALVCANVIGQQPEARFFAVPRADYEVVETWRSIGMRGTGSNTLVLPEVFVPQELSFDRSDLLAGQAPAALAPCHRAPLRAVNGLCFGAPAHGAARGGVAAWMESLESTGVTQAAELRLARSSGELDAASLLFDRVASEADGEQAHAARATRDCALATDLSLTAINRVFRSCGTSAHLEANVLQRFWRDANTAGSHVVLQLDAAAKTYASQVLAHR